MHLKQPTEITAQHPTKAFGIEINNYLDAIKKTVSNEDLSKCIINEFIKLCKDYMDESDELYDELEQTSINTNDIFLFHYSYSDVFKDFALLNRDVLLHLKIAEHKLLDTTINKESAVSHFEASKELLFNVTNDLLTTIITEHDAIYASQKNSTKFLETIKHHKNPWGIYKSQFTVIEKQLNDIVQAYLPLNKIIGTFHDIKAHHNDFLNKITSNSETIKIQMGKTIKLIEENDSYDGTTDLISFLDETINGIGTEHELQDVYTQTLESNIKTLVVQTIPIETNNGLLLNRTIDFNKTVKKWFDFEILPRLFELWDNHTNMKSFFKHSLLNLKSSLLVSKNNPIGEALPLQLKTLQNTLSTLSLSNTSIKELVLDINKKFDSQFRLSLIFSNNPFLEVSLQSSLTQFATEQNTFFSKIKNRFSGHLDGFSSKYKKSTLFTNQNKVEATIDCISYRMFKEANAHYDSLFLNKNFIGDLFLVPREEQELALQNCMKQWKDGFNKSILLTGDRLSGKSTFVEYVSRKYFAKNAIHIKPDNNLTFHGRKFNVSKDLNEILQNVKKNLLDNETLIVIDDLELWRDGDHTLLSNVRTLLSFMESASNKTLIIATTSMPMQQHLGKRIKFSENFSNKINLNKATFNEIHKAILLRHGASHKNLITKTGVPLNKNQIEDNVRKLTQGLDYNLGAVLQAWTYGTTDKHENNVVYEQQDFSIKDFFNHTEIIILKYIVLYRYINEYTLKGFVSKHQGPEYKSSLKRLVNTKILLRNSDGFLQLNPVVYKDINELLIYKGAL